ncbi:MAG: hypothetical protein A3E01_05655 [Gammaproteobacteria bacterium RIFCSPHIGHO2_12_FULL_63_22]|nr:MAG: hypothetical protein A3E01_05655 [Gammaproteobacteria bacterium RIFCSPHIGHO2_12_FULL_63_22]
MIIYEVNLFVKLDIEAAFRAWLDAHVREIIALPGFTGASVLDRIEPAGAPDEFVVCTQYRLTDAAALETYLRDHAPRMRSDGVSRFGDAFRAERRVLSAGAEY